MAEIQYSLNDYNAVLCDTFKSAKHSDYKGSYKLPEGVIQIITNLSKKFGVTISSHSTPTSKKHVKNSNSHIEQSWIQRDFKPTTVIDKKEGIDKIMNDVRISLNKISNKNYETIRDTIIIKIQELLVENDNTNNDRLQKIANNIFEIASTNKFFSEIYAKLYRELSEKFPEIFNQIVSTFLTGFTETMRNIKYVDQNVNYDEFCKYNKENDKRKATSVFITNLIKEKVIDVEVLVSMISNIQTILDEYMNTPNKTNEVEEITENIFLLFTNDMNLLQKTNTSHLFDKIQILASMKPKELPSISSRAIFKYMDILEKFQKNSMESTESPHR
jgi:cobalamin biosynthesis Mg chelatase CobN